MSLQALQRDIKPILRNVKFNALANGVAFGAGDEYADYPLKSYIEDSWHVVEPSTPFIPNWHIDVISDHLEAVSAGDIRNLLINLPPRHMKSLLVSVFWPTWEWIKRPQMRFLFASYAQSLSKRDSLKCRRIIESTYYQSRFGHIYKLTSDQNEKMRFENNKTGYRVATSVGGAATGEGGDFLICDDPHNAQEAQSDTMRENALTWWDETMSTRLNNPKKGAKVIVMQRLHEQDLSGHVLEQGGYEHLCLPAEYEPRAFVCLAGLSHDPRTEPGELLWEGHFGQEEIDSLKRSLGSYGAAGQLQQRPSPAEGGMLKRHWWQYWKPKGSDLPPVMVKQPDGSFKNYDAVELPESFDGVIQSWDMSFKDEKAAKGGKPDFVAAGVWGKAGANKFRLAEVHERMDFPKTCSAVEALSKAYPKARAKLVEDKANGAAVIAQLRNKIPGLIPVEPEGGKIVRANAVAPEIESGNVYLPHPQLAVWTEAFIEECAAFPNGANDDRVDEMTQALNWMQTKKSLGWG
jgi:predicted phage terminase large subunit-like protein